ncbi:MAG: hypothetical protein KH366_07555 [Clostridiaceae bacterium]|nr:hypothetical protein [Clostridiaceae bacterium]
MKLLIGGLVLLALGILMLAAPDLFYQITESWKNNSSAEPSDLYKLNLRIGGIVFLLVGIAGIITYFVI